LLPKTRQSDSAAIRRDFACHDQEINAMILSDQLSHYADLDEAM
jgi:hypothetical protein